MKKILISQRIEQHSEYDEVRDMLDTAWYPFLESIDLLPVPMPNTGRPETYFDHLDLAGVVLTGGNNLASVEQNTKALSQQRDAVEHRILDLATARNLPVLGVCRGLQIIADHFGGTLEPVTGHVATRHELDPVPDSRYADFFTSCREVNSFHDYRVANIGDEMTVLATSKNDGVIEAIEHITHPLLAIMWHPERERPYRECERELFRTFFQSKESTS